MMNETQSAVPTLQKVSAKFKQLISALITSMSTCSPCQRFLFKNIEPGDIQGTVLKSQLPTAVDVPFPSFSLVQFNPLVSSLCISFSIVAPPELTLRFWPRASRLKGQKTCSSRTLYHEDWPKDLTRKFPTMSQSLNQFFPKRLAGGPFRIDSEVISADEQGISNCLTRLVFNFSFNPALTYHPFYGPRLQSFDSLRRPSCWHCQTAMAARWLP